MRHILKNLLDGLLLTICIGSAIAVNAQDYQQRFDSSGSFTVPAGITTVFVEAWGGGGGGAYSSVGIGGYRFSGSGGGGGGFSKGYINVSPGSNLTIAVGEGGLPGQPGARSGVGSVLAGGGQPGQFETVLGAPISNTFGGAGGAGTFTGGNGANGSRSDPGTYYNAGGGGGGSARTTANGGHGVGITGGAGEGNGGQGEAFFKLPPATAGAVPGGGGGGGMDARSGGKGRVVVYWTEPVIATIAKADETCFKQGGSAIVTAGGGNGVFSYLWSNGQTTPSVDHLAPGNYTCVVSSGYAKTTLNITIAEGPQLPALVATQNSIATINQTADGNPNYYLAGCNEVIAMLYTTNAPNPISGPTTAKVWIDDKQDTRFVRRHYEITPQNNASIASGRIILFFTQEDFDLYNKTKPAMLLPTGPTDPGNYKGNLYIEKRGGNGDANGTIETYTGAATTIHPEIVNWDGDNNRWEVVFSTVGFSGFWAKTGDHLIALPVTFGSLDAVWSNGQLKINWTTLNETNNDHFDVEVSTDGVNFRKLASVKSKHESGNIETSSNYEVILTQSDVAVLSLVLSALLFSGFIFKSRRRWLLAIVHVLLICSFINFSCSKDQSEAVETGTDNIFVRIAQVDKDGKRSYSKIVKAITP